MIEIIIKGLRIPSITYRFMKATEFLEKVDSFCYLKISNSTGSLGKVDSFC